jgi:hypothetical protein
MINSAVEMLPVARHQNSPAGCRATFKRQVFIEIPISKDQSRLDSGRMPLICIGNQTEYLISSAAIGSDYLFLLLFN